MSLWKYLVLVGGLLGIAGFFAPFLEYKAPDGSLTGGSGYQIATNTVDVSELMAKAKQLGLVTADEATKATSMLQQGIGAYRYAMIAVFVPAALLLLIGLVGFVRKRMGRLAGVLAIVAGLGALAVWIFFYREPDPSQQTIGQLGLGIYCLAVGGLLGVIGGLGSVIVPDRTA